MPAELERCVRSIKGVNRRTGKPYTESEKFAICNAQLKKSKAASFGEEIILDEEVVAAVENSMAVCMRKMMDSGKAKNPQEAKEMCAGLMAKSNFDMAQLELILVREL